MKAVCVVGQRSISETGLTRGVMLQKKTLTCLFVLQRENMHEMGFHAARSGVEEEEDHEGEEGEEEG